MPAGNFQCPPLWELQFASSKEVTVAPSGGNALVYLAAFPPGRPSKTAAESFVVVLAARGSVWESEQPVFDMSPPEHLRPDGKAASRD